RHSELRLYEELALYVLFYRYEKLFYDHIITTDDPNQDTIELPPFRKFAADVEHFLGIDRVRHTEDLEPAHLFALFFQLRRAFHYIFRHILGGSMAAARVRAAAWESILTRDIRRYRRQLFDRMHEISTLVTGPSGTGKELVASAIGLSRYIPFDESSGAFAVDFRRTFHPLNLSALSPTLIESELFGHRKGAFTGAIADRKGHLDGKTPSHTVFLDEIGEVDVSIQLKLLRVLQSREFHRPGDSAPLRFDGKIIAATNRCLAEEIAAGRFRSDLYYRLCSDIVVTPSLAEQIGGDKDELQSLVALVSRRIVGDEECAAVADEVFDWILENLDPTYPWPGNMRELSQCVQNLLIHRSYQPLDPIDRAAPPEQLAHDLAQGRLNAQELLSRYCTMVYAETDSYSETARRLGLYRRTVRAKIDEVLLEALRADQAPLP
ncbi:MAG: sigma-54-dependent Fis family transcriptional regulator, partial [Deltaproteobacteria bacterium]|nr:sigma-54-dependent Fis family transcriptional regulator [Deltaproteobacteria bacterium]